jgi:hypothetical protein
MVRVSSGPQCICCPHLAKQHNLDGDGRCRVVILCGWDHETNAYASSRPCDCPGYLGEEPGGCGACEYVSSSPNCVHCGRVKV